MLDLSLTSIRMLQSGRGALQLAYISLPASIALHVRIYMSPDKMPAAALYLAVYDFVAILDSRLHAQVLTRRPHGGLYISQFRTVLAC